MKALGWNTVLAFVFLVAGLVGGAVAGLWLPVETVAGDAGAREGTGIGTGTVMDASKPALVRNYACEFFKITTTGMRSDRVLLSFAEDRRSMLVQSANSGIRTADVVQDSDGALELRWPRTDKSDVAHALDGAFYHVTVEKSAKNAEMRLFVPSQAGDVAMRHSDGTCSPTRSGLRA